ncbi:MAG: ATP-binding protein [Lentisphaeria bacterium]|nr:ATP-binding protein [Lentisphaeria bacterium]
MMIERPVYLQKLKDRMHDGMIKIVTGLRRSGKSYLLFELFRKDLLDSGIPADHIIGLELDMHSNEKYRDPDVLLSRLSQKMKAGGQYYILLDEVQMLKDFVSVLNELLHYRNADVYVTGSNSKFLSSDVVTEFRGRGNEVRIHPLSFSEYFPAFHGTRDEAWQEYFTYGGLPQILSMKSDEQKADYLKNLFAAAYLKDIKERNKIRHEAEMEMLVDILASATGSLTNPLKLSNTFRSKRGASFPESTVARYCQYLENAFLINRSVRYDIKGKDYINTPFKYYFEDVGLRNARLNFRQQDENHIMENIVYNELRYRGFSVDVGVVEIREKQTDGKMKHKQLEIDFVANSGSRRYYIQSAFAMSPEKEIQEKRPFLRINDSFKKIILVRENIKPRRDDNGIVTMGLLDFLLLPNSLEL